MRLQALRDQIKEQRAVTMSGYRGMGVEVECDELEALVELAEATAVLLAGWRDYSALVDNGDAQAVRVEAALHALESRGC